MTKKELEYIDEMIADAKNEMDYWRGVVEYWKAHGNEKAVQEGKIHFEHNYGRYEAYKEMKGE